MTSCANGDGLALLHVFDGVIGVFASKRWGEVNLFGWRSPDQKLETGARICWYPGDPNGALGALNAPRIGQAPRRLATLDELFTVELQAYDKDDPTNERKQYARTRELFDRWWSAIHKVAHGVVRIAASQWITTTKNVRAGACLRIVCAVQAGVPDMTTQAVAADAEQADISVGMPTAIEETPVDPVLVTVLKGDEP